MIGTQQQLPPQLPFVFDRSDGGVYGGTPTPDGASIAENSGGSTANTSTNQILIFDELPTSPQIDLGEQATIIHQFEMDPYQAELAASKYTRGNTYYDSEGRLCKVLNFRADSQNGDRYLCTLTSEGLNFYIPPAEFDCQPILINPAAQKHPRYTPLQQKFLKYVNPKPSGGYEPFFPLNAINQSVLGLSLTQANQQTAALQDQNNFYVDSGSGGNQIISNGPDLIAQASALELLKKLRRGQETFYLAGYKVSYSTFDFQPQDYDPGGRIEDPVLSGALPPEFWQDADGNNSFTNLTSAVSPQFYQNGISWFREADSQVFQRTWWRKTQSWNMAPAGGPIVLSWQGQSATYVWDGHWDKQWYTPIAPGASGYPPYDTDLNIP